MQEAPSIPRENFSCLTRLDQNRLTWFFQKKGSLCHFFLRSHWYWFIVVDVLTKLQPSWELQSLVFTILSFGETTQLLNTQVAHLIIRILYSHSTSSSNSILLCRAPLSFSFFFFPFPSQILAWSVLFSFNFADIAHGYAETDSGEKHPLVESIGDDEFVNNTLVSIVQQRGAAVIAARKLSSALSGSKPPFFSFPP